MSRKRAKRRTIQEINAEIEARWRAGEITDAAFDWWLRTVCGF